MKCLFFISAFCIGLSFISIFNGGNVVLSSRTFESKPVISSESEDTIESDTTMLIKMDSSSNRILLVNKKNGELSVFELDSTGRYYYKKF